MHDVTMSEAVTIPDDEDLDYEVGWDLESDAKIEVKATIPLQANEEALFRKLKAKIKKRLQLTYLNLERPNLERIRLIGWTRAQRIKLI